MENPYELLYMRRTGDEWAEKELLRQYTPLIRSELHNILIQSRRMEIYKEDFLQEGMIAIDQAADSYREDQNAGWLTFLVLVVRRKYASMVRHLRTKSRVHMHDVLPLDGFVAETGGSYDFLRDPDPMHNPVYRFDYVEAAERYKSAYEGLLPIEKETLRQLEKYGSYREASTAMGITYKSFDGRMQRIRRKLRKAILRVE